jgi:hypothetical protein
MATSKHSVRIKAECTFEVEVMVTYNERESEGPAPRAIEQAAIDSLRDQGMKAFCPVGRDGDVLLLAVNYILDSANR